MTTKKKTEPVQEATEAEVPETPVSQEVAEVPEAHESSDTETPVKEEQKKQHGPLDYINKAIELVEAKNASENCMEYRVAITALNEAKMFISKKGG
jgi:hypothetical protein